MVYEKIYLISPTETRHTSKLYRLYGQVFIERMDLVAQAKLPGFTLQEIGKLIRDWEGNRLTSSQKRAIISDKLHIIDQQLRELRKVRQYLEEKLSCLRPDGSVRRATKLENAAARKRAMRTQPVSRRQRIAWLDDTAVGVGLIIETGVKNRYLVST